MQWARLERSLLFGLGCLIAVPASAQGSGNVHCTISTTALAFGQYVPSRSGASDFTATIEVTCTAPGEAPVAMEGSISLIGTGDGGRHELRDGPNRLGYQLFLDPARTNAWGDGNGAGRTRPVSGVAAGAAPLRISVTVYGRILGRHPGTQVGRYTDRITAVLNY